MVVGLGPRRRWKGVLVWVMALSMILEVCQSQSIASKLKIKLKKQDAAPASSSSLHEENGEWTFAWWAHTLQDVSTLTTTTSFAGILLTLVMIGAATTVFLESKAEEDGE
eukprot:scaffold209912_cov54-Attheya_sp.AAC.1